MVEKKLNRYDGPGGKVVIPDGITTIGMMAFYNRNDIRSVVIPTSVTRIETYAFHDCLNLTSVTLPRNLAFVGPQAFHVGAFPVVRGLGRKQEIKVYASEDGEMMYSVLKMADGTDAYYKMFEKAFQNPSRFDFDLYDSFFPNIKVSGVKLTIALYRLDHPYCLSDQAKETYIKYVQRYSKSILTQAIDSDATGSFEKFVSYGLIKSNMVDEIIDYAVSKNRTAWVALLSEWKNTHCKTTKVKEMPSAAFHFKGDIVTFGEYDFGSGKKPIEWIVLDVTDKKYLLVSRYYVERMSFQSEPWDQDEGMVDWKDSIVRQWLNSDFLSVAFSDAEKARILLTKNKNIKEENTEDRVFLLGKTELMNLLGIRNDSDYAMKLGFRYGVLQSSEEDGEWIRTTDYKRKMNNVRLYKEKYIGNNSVELTVKEINDILSGKLIKSASLTWREWNTYSKFGDVCWVRPAMWIKK